MKTKLNYGKTCPLHMGDGGHSPLLSGDEGAQGSPRFVKWGFTLAEVLITLGVIGVVAAVTMPMLITNVQERIRKEQVRTVKYKLTKATDKMKSLGKIGPYNEPATKNFVNELKKHMTIAKVCDSGNLTECWPSDTVNVHTAQNTLTATSINSLAHGTDLKALALGSGGEETVGIVTGDGIPMLLVYSPKCQALDEMKTYTWSVDDGKPVTNATTNCISAIFDINGSKGPNRIGQDIRTLNSLFGSVDIGSLAGMTSEECNKIKTKYGINECCAWCDSNGLDRWTSAVKACADMGLHLPDMVTMANIANARYGTTLIGTYTLYLNSGYGGDSCKDYVKDTWDYGNSFRVDTSDAIICNADTSLDSSTGFSIDGFYWASPEYGAVHAYGRSFTENYSYWITYGRTDSGVRALCVGD